VLTVSNRINLIRGTTKALAVDLVDENGEPIALSRLVGATATFTLRVNPTDVVNVLLFATTTTPDSLSFELDEAVLNLNFAPADTSALDIGLYFYQIEVTLTDGGILDVIPWDLLDLNLGGAATPTPPVFDNTVTISADYPLSGDMQYMTPGGSPIVNAQVRVYYKSDYDAGNLASPIGITMTNEYGKWRQPILVLPGFTYVARLEKPYEFGPDIKEFFA
jgi:hypothetical protein